MKIYTKTGDDGTTGLLGGPRVLKSAARIEALGDVDETNALIGLARSGRLPVEIDGLLAQVQHDLFTLGAQLAVSSAKAAENTSRPEAAIADRHIRQLEQAIDSADAQLPTLREFILPGGTAGAAALFLARSVCRRAERRVVALRETSGEEVSPGVVTYLNRLSDLLFVVARLANFHASQPDVPWRKDAIH